MPPPDSVPDSVPEHRPRAADDAVLDFFAARLRPAPDARPT